VDNALLHPEIDYSYFGNNVSFLNRIWDDQDITFYYTFTNNTMVYNNYFGSDASGSDGTMNRQLLAGGVPLVVAVDTYTLHPDIDYTFVGNLITFKNIIWDSQVITTWHN